MENHHHASTLALDAAESMDIADSRERSPTRSISDIEEPFIESNLSDEGCLIMKIPDKDPVKEYRAQEAAENAHEKAKRLSRHLNRHSARVSMANSPPRFRSSSSGPSTRTPLDLNDIPLHKLKRRENYSIEDDTDEDEDEDENEGEGEGEGEGDERNQPVSSNWWKSLINTAKYYLRGLNLQEALREDQRDLRRVSAHDPPLPSGQITPIHERNSDLDSYVPRTREGILSASLRLHSALSPLSSGASTPGPNRERLHDQNEQHPLQPKFKSRSTGTLDVLFGARRRKIEKDSVRIKIHIAETLIRQRFLVKMCMALMTYGAPTHRLEGTR